MEEQEEKTKRLEKGKMALVYIIAMIFITLVITAFFLYRTSEEVKTLESHKKVLINRLSEEVYAKRKLQKQTDSLKNFLETRDPVPMSADVQALP